MVLRDYFPPELGQLITGYADTIGFQPIYEWEPFFAYGNSPFGRDMTRKFLVCCKKGAALKDSCLLMFNYPEHSIYSFNLTGTRYRRFYMPKSGVLRIRIHEVTATTGATGVLCSPYITKSSYEQDPSLFFDLAQKSFTPQIKELGGEIILSSTKSYIMLEENLISFWWRTSRDTGERSEIHQNSKPYFYIRYVVEDNVEDDSLLLDGKDDLSQGFGYDMKLGDNKLFVFGYTHNHYFMTSFVLTDIEDHKKRNVLYKQTRDGRLS